MKKLLVFKKLSFQLIVATAISFLVSTGSFLVLEKNLVMHSMYNLWAMIVDSVRYNKVVY